MRKSLCYCLLFLAGVVQGDARSSFLSAFTEPPFEAKPWVYWYWMNGNITKEGAVEDLRALHRVGVGGAYLMDIGIHPKGPVAYRSAEWFEATGAVMKEAEKLGMQIGFHCPGWSASGGPWITPDKGMQEVVWSETTVGSGQSSAGTIVLPQPPARLGLYRDIAVVAFPALKQDTNLLKSHPFKVMAEGKELTGKGAAFDGKPDTGVEFPSSFEIVFDQPVQARSVFLRLACRSGDFTAQVEAKQQNGRYRKIGIVRSGHPGPFSARHGATAWSAIASDTFRFTFSDRNDKRALTIEELRMTEGFRLHDWPALAGFGTKPVREAKDDVSPLAEDCIKPDEILDLTEKMKPDGTLAWTPPKGDWTILRMGYVPTGVEIKPPPLNGGVGLECDKMSVEVTDFHYDKMMKPLFEAYGKSVAGKVLSKYHVDSYEPGWQNWTPRMSQAFKKGRGYELTKWLPALTGRVVGSEEQTLNVLWDFRRTIGDLYADAHYGRLAERCHADGISFSTEPYGGPFEFLQVGGRSDYPMVEFWTGPRNVLPVEQTGAKSFLHGVSSGHIYGKRIIGSEAFTSEEGWLIHPYAIKSLGDRMFAAGVNQFVIHVSAHQPYLREGVYPGFTSGINGIHFDRGNTWFDYGAKEWVDYLIRCQGVLQQGLHVADVAYFQGDDSPGEGTRMTLPMPEGYDADCINAEVLARAKAIHGRLVLPDTKSYRYLVLPKSGQITYASLKELQRLSSAGVVCVGPKPVGSPSLSDRATATAYTACVEKMWQAKSIPNPASLQELFAQDQLAPDFSYKTDDKLTLHYTHRQDAASDVYFVANGLKRSGQVQCTFRTEGGTPRLWNPVDGSMREMAVYTVEKDGRLTLPLWFNPSDSFFVVFDRADKKRRPREISYKNTVHAPTEKLTIVKAEYGVGKTQLDLTDPVRAEIKDNTLDLANFVRFKGDPVPGQVKQMTLHYLLDQKPFIATAKDGETITLPPRIAEQAFDIVAERNSVKVLALKNGEYSIDGKTLEIQSLPLPCEIKGDWTITFQKARGAPEQIMTRELKTLGSFEDFGVKHFSGTATYRTAFEYRSVMAHGSNLASRVYLDLGEVAVIASATLNGKPLGLRWKPPFRFEVTGLLREGKNELEVDVTTTWVNRLIGDEYYPDDVTPKGTWKEGGLPVVPEWLVKNTPRPEPRRITFAAFKFWKATDTLHPAGLIGPVSLHYAQSVHIPTGE